MNRGKAVLTIIIVCVLAACFPFSKPLNKKTCTLKNTDFSSEMAVYYDDKENVETLEYTFHQKIDKEIMASMNEQEIVATLKSIFMRDNNANISVEVEFDRKKAEGIIQVSTDVEDLSNEELEYYGLKEETKLKNVLDGAKLQGYTCEEKK